MKNGNALFMLRVVQKCWRHDT